MHQHPQLDVRASLAASVFRALSHRPSASPVMRQSATTAVRIDRSARHGVSHADRAESAPPDGGSESVAVGGAGGAAGGGVAGVDGALPVASAGDALPPSSRFAAAIRASASSTVVGSESVSVDDGAAAGAAAPPHAASERSAAMAAKETEKGSARPEVIPAA